MDLPLASWCRSWDSPRFRGDGSRDNVGWIRISGSGEPGLVNGAQDKARFNFPRGLVVWKNAVFVADYNNQAVRKFALV